MLTQLIQMVKKFVIDLKEYRYPEIWKSIQGYEGSYEVSSSGRVRSVERVVDHGLTKRYTIKEKVLKPNSDNGFNRVFLYDIGRRDRRRFFVHKLVAKGFVGNPLKYKHVEHIDGNRLNNHFTNLRWKEHTR